MNINKIKLQSMMTKNEVNELISKWLTLEDDIYISSSYPHNWQCKCGEIIQKRRWNNIKHRSEYMCRKCSLGRTSTNKSLSNIDLNKFMSKDKVNQLISKWLLLEDDIYLGVKHKHNWRCECGNIIEGRTWDYIRSKLRYRCLVCIESERDSKSINAARKHEYKYIKSYKIGSILPNGEIANKKYVRVKHVFCGHVYEVDMGHLVNRKDNCPNCCGSYEKSFAYHIEVELGEPLDKYWDFDKNTVNPYHIYKSSSEKVWIKCNNEEINKLNGLKKQDYHESYHISCCNFIRGNRCSYCASKKVHPYDSFGYHNFDKVLSWHPDNDISPFRVSRVTGKKYKFICYECGYIWMGNTPTISTANSWCPRCSASRGERRITNILNEYGVIYQLEKTFEDLRGINDGLLRYDFYLPDYNLLIEYQGEQHEKFIKAVHKTHCMFKKQQEHDERKREYAKNHEIKLLEIWYYDFDNIKEILEEHII